MRSKQFTVDCPVCGEGLTFYMVTSAGETRRTINVFWQAATGTQDHIDEHLLNAGPTTPSTEGTP